VPGLNCQGSARPFIAGIADIARNRRNQKIKASEPYHFGLI